MDTSKEHIRRKVRRFYKQMSANKDEEAQEELAVLFEDIYELLNKKTDAEDVKQLLVEMRNGFKAMDKRFEALQREMDKRFEAVDKRFEAVDKRFEDMNRRFDGMQWLIGLGFTLLTLLLSLFHFFG